MCLQMTFSTLSVGTVTYSKGDAIFNYMRITWHLAERPLLAGIYTLPKK